MSGRLSLLSGFGLCALAASSCTTTHTNRDNQIGSAVRQPFRDVSLVREEPPEILKRAAAAPYDLQMPPDCGAVFAEIAALDAVLGPDVDKVDVNEKTGIDAGGLTASAIGGVIGLPFRGVIRTVSGAEYREEVLADAILSGIARRAFLKGTAHAGDCEEPATPNDPPSPQL
jgi:hypothetical protein